MLRYYADDMFQNGFRRFDQCLRMAPGNQTEVPIVISVGKSFIGDREILFPRLFAYFRGVRNIHEDIIFVFGNGHQKKFGQCGILGDFVVQCAMGLDMMKGDIFFSEDGYKVSYLFLDTLDKYFGWDIHGRPSEIFFIGIRWMRPDLDIEFLRQTNDPLH